jgi:hypothetical protein
VAATTTTTIRGVSIFSRQRRRKADVFDIALSPEGVVIRRPGREDQRMAWDRVSQWEIEERSGCVILTLRGGGSVTPLRVKGWTLDDLEAVMRQATAGTSDPATEEETADAAAEVPVPEDLDAGAPPPRTTPSLSRAARRLAARQRRFTWKAIATVVLLGVLAAAVAVVLLQSAGVISWGFLGPTA